MYWCSVVGVGQLNLVDVIATMVGWHGLALSTGLWFLLLLLMEDDICFSKT